MATLEKEAASFLRRLSLMELNVILTALGEDELDADTCAEIPPAVARRIAAWAKRTGLSQIMALLIALFICTQLGDAARRRKFLDGMAE